MKNPINMTPAELIENGFDRPARIHVTKINGEKIFGSLNIGKLRHLERVITSSKKPVFMTENNELVYCEMEMAKRINQRLEDLKND